MRGKKHLTSYKEGLSLQDQHLSLTSKKHSFNCGEVGRKSRGRQTVRTLVLIIYPHIC